jgi:hypothetical protein
MKLEMKVMSHWSRYRRSAVIAAPLMIGVLFTPSSGAAAGDPYEENPHEAEIYFRDGVSLMKQGEHALACEKFAESYRLDPSGGTILNLALCNERLGKLASALMDAEEALQIAINDKHAKRQASARKLIKELGAKVARITVVVPGDVAALKSLSISVDDTVLKPNQWGVGLPVEPGEHVIVASAPGYASMRTIAQVSNHGVNVSVAIKPLEAEREPAATTTAGPAQQDRSAPSVSPPQSKAPAEARALKASTLSSLPPAPITEPSGWGARRVTGAILGSAGLGVIAIGAGFGVRSLVKKSESDRHCDDNLCYAPGIEPREEAIWTGVTATALMVTGGAALIGGVVLFATGSPSREGSASVVKDALVSIGPAGARFSTRW